MQKIKLLLQEHYIAVIFAVLVGLMMVWPYIYFIYQSGGDQYQGINFIASEGETYYFTRAKEVYDGYLKISNPIHYEYKDSPYTQPGLGEATMAVMARIFHLDVYQIFWLSDFILPFLLFLVLYWLCFQITRSKLVSLLIPWFIILGSNFIFFPKDFISFVLGNFSYLDTPQSFLNYARGIHPQFSSLIFFLWLTLFYQWYKDISFNKLKLFLVAILFGALVYSYIYSFLLAFVLMGLIFLINLFKKDWSKIRQLLFIIISGFVILIPYLINLYQFSNFSSGLDVGLQNRGFYFSHIFVWSNLLFLSLIMLLILNFRHKEKKDISFLILIVASLFICLNQQVITGLVLFPGHWHWYYTTPLFILTSLIFFSLLIKKIFNNKNLLYTSFIVIFILVFINALLIQYHSFLNHSSEYSNYQRYAKVYEWLENNTEKDSVILSDRSSPFGSFIPIFTSNNIYQNGTVHDLEIYLTPQERINHNYFVGLYLIKVGPEQVKEYIKKNQAKFIKEIDAVFSFRTKYYDQSYPIDEKIEKSVEDYQEFYQNDFEKNLKKYRLDYIINDKKLPTAWDLDRFNFLEFITEINSFSIYKVI